MKRSNQCTFLHVLIFALFHNASYNTDHDTILSTNFVIHLASLQKQMRSINHLKNAH